jgi:hypothetical protein
MLQPFHGAAAGRLGHGSDYGSIQRMGIPHPNFG